MKHRKMHVESYKPSSKEHKNYLNMKFKEESDFKLSIASDALRRIMSIYETGVINGARDSMNQIAKTAYKEINRCP